MSKDGFTRVSSPAEKAFTVIDAKKMSVIVDEFREALLTAVRSGGSPEEHIRGHMSGLKLALLNIVSDAERNRSPAPIG
jgi:hypothetical protein